MMPLDVVAKALLASGALSLALAFSPVVRADADRVDDPTKAEKQVEETTKTQTEEKRKRILEEATSAIRETENALTALDEGKEKEALEALERATGKLEIILARDPELALAPAGVTAVSYDVLADIDAINEVTEEAEEALEDGRVQDARRLIRGLASETVISVSNIPLATYPDAIKRSVKLIDDGKVDEAKHVLQMALNTLVITDTVIPLPIVMAEELLKEAKPLAEKADRSEEENERLADLLKATRTELEFAEALGYGSKEDFVNLHQQLDEIEKNTEGGKSGTGFFDKIGSYLKNAFDSSQAQRDDQS